MRKTTLSFFGMLTELQQHTAQHSKPQ